MDHDSGNAWGAEYTRSAGAEYTESAALRNPVPSTRPGSSDVPHGLVTEHSDASVYTRTRENTGPMGKGGHSPDLAAAQRHFLR
jgi:hypothetical protein